MEVNYRLKAIVLEVVDNQIKELPYVKKRFEELSAKYGVKKAKEMIASAALSEIYEVMKNNKPFNEERYKRELDKLK